MMLLRWSVGIAPSGSSVVGAGADGVSASTRATTWSRRTRSPTATSTRTMPSCGATTRCSIFMASIVDDPVARGDACRRPRREPRRRCRASATRSSGAVAPRRRVRARRGAASSARAAARAARSRCVAPSACTQTSPSASVARRRRRTAAGSIVERTSRSRRDDAMPCVGGRVDARAPSAGHRSRPTPAPSRTDGGSAEPPAGAREPQRRRVAGARTGAATRARGRTQRGEGRRRSVEGGQPVDEPGVEVARAHVGVGEQRPEERDVRVDAEHDGVGERLVEPRRAPRRGRRRTR